MPKVEVSVGELIDKITILQIKQDNITDENKLKHIQVELDILTNTVREEGIEIPQDMIDKLRQINQELWDAEDVIRDCENKEDFGEDFVKCARLDAILNDKRFLAKNDINNFTNSLVKEQKSYEGLYTSN